MSLTPDSEAWDSMAAGATIDDSDSSQSTLREELRQRLSEKLVSGFSNQTCTVCIILMKIIIRLHDQLL